MSNEKHTPTPWHVKEGSNNYLTPEEALGIDAKDPRDPSADWAVAAVWKDIEPNGGSAAANAAFIVRACNSHKALVDALRRVINRQCYCSTVEDEEHGSFTSECPRCIAAVAALKLAKEA